MTTADVEVDARGQLCPLPVLALARAAREVGDGVIAVLADDEAARTDIPAWCELRGAQLLAHEQGGEWDRFLVRVGTSTST